MQINSVSAALPSAASNLSSTAPKAAKAAAAPAQQAASTTPAPATQTTSAAPAPANASSTKPAGGSAAVQSSASQAASAATANLVSQIYSTTVAGKSYSGSIEQSGGQYVISIPNLPGATASASTAQAAENALTLKIDILV